MLKSYQKSRFPHFLRKWSESIRTTLPSNFLSPKQAIFLSTFIFIAEKLRKISKVCLSLSQFTWGNPIWNNGLPILFPFIPNTPEQNGMIERFFRSVKEECVWQHRFKNRDEAFEIITQWIDKYHKERPHSALGYLTPEEFRKECKVA